MVTKDIAVLLLYIAYQAQIPSFWINVAGVGLISLFLVLSFMLAQVLFASRQLTSLSDESQEVLGKPLLFPVNFNHRRFTPTKDRFRNRYLAVGVPVGLRCRIGNLLAIDDSSLDVSLPPGDFEMKWNRILSHLSCWFSVDSTRFLHRGDHGLSLREKLDQYLLSQNEDPSQWPYAYLLGIPQFLGWSRSVVSWWYLYDKNRELDAVILEINNSYYEKRNILLRVSRVSEKPHSLPDETSEEYLDELKLVRSLPSAPRSTFYQAQWHKYIFASPFEKVDGVVSNRMMDPLQPSSWKPNTSFSNMTTMEESGEVRMATRLTCDGPPVDPTKMNTFEAARLLFFWTIPGMITTLVIIFKALKIRLMGTMKMHTKPPVRNGSVGRPITKMELDLEPFFRSYLASHVETYPDPIELTYLPCRSFTNETICMRSPSYENAAHVCRLTVEPTDPGFYSRMIMYIDVMTALAQETQPTGYVADPTSQRLLVSDVNLLISILEHALSEKARLSRHTLPSWSKRKFYYVLSLLRGSCGLTFMDDFALSCSQPLSLRIYSVSAVRLSVAGTFCFGSLLLLGIYEFLASYIVRWLILDVISSWRSRDFFSRPRVEPRLD
ncbi:hypothetical protein N7495_002553 [Penicillium taxi]|uniref:uncharacterized protein n=1 Tax=Penicillium taxi TaxID=168475 RepID=UPI002544F753|nr:uncharacterized protein N7495_002553 [Penicillium taxi]KAJ5902025.1 hypothetical protein N7495_002553 [Penicillium taxi]